MVMVVIHMVFTWQFHTFLIFVYDISCVPLFRYGHVFLWDSGSSVGEISGHSKFINAIDYRPTRPFRVVTAGEDKHVCWFEGPPFRYKNKLSVSQVKGKLTWWCFLACNSAGDRAGQKFHTDYDTSVLSSVFVLWHKVCVCWCGGGGGGYTPLCM